MLYRNQKKLLPNQAQILVEFVYKKTNALIGAYFPLANHKFVVWRMNYNDRSCYWGHYFSSIRNMFDYLWKKYKDEHPIDLNDFRFIEINCVKFNNEIVPCNINEAQLFSTYGRLKTGEVKCLSDHYTSMDCATWANWLAMQNNLVVCNLMEGKCSAGLKSCYISK